MTDQESGKGIEQLAAVLRILRSMSTELRAEVVRVVMAAYVESEKPEEDTQNVG